MKVNLNQISGLKLRVGPDEVEWSGDFRGPPGADSIVPGPAGTPGSKMLQGSAAPAGSLGVIGDWYYRTSNWTFYEKTSEQSWTARGGSVKGADSTVAGPPGAAAVVVTFATDAEALSFSQANPNAAVFSREGMT